MGFLVAFGLAVAISVGPTAATDLRFETTANGIVKRLLTPPPQEEAAPFRSRGGPRGCQGARIEARRKDARETNGGRGDGDGRITLDELFAFTVGFVKKNRPLTHLPQTPQLTAPGMLGKMVLARH